jgi:DsbC/DsbD-like thiol-disulfide interchange protein
VPYPGTFVTDAKGIVRTKHFEKAYAERQTAASLLALAGETPNAAVETTTPTFTLRASASNASAAPGQRVTLVLDFAMKPRMHAYAPGVKGYKPLRLRLDAQPLVTLHEAAFPPSQSYRFAPLDETVPVFEGRFRVSQDVTLAGARDLAELLKTPDPAIDIVGTLEYQVCSDRICYAPSSLPLRWTIKVVALDRERSPEAIRHQPSKQ